MPRTEPEISREKLFEKLEYLPHSDLQWAIHRSNARFRAPCCGRRWGKSTWAGHEMTLKMFVPHSINWIVGPEYSLGEKEFRVVYNDFRKLDLLGHCSKSYNVDQGKMRIYFKDIDSLCEVKSATRPESLVGEGLDHVCMSEAAKHSLATWQMYVEPALSDKRGSADFPSTPQGFNWYKGLYDLGQLRTKEFEEYESWRAPSWTNTVAFPDGFDDEEMVRIRSAVSDIYWQQEYAAEFTSVEGMLYPEFDEDIHVEDFAFNPSWTNWWALDFGYTDPFVCLDIMVDPSNRKYVWREYQVSYKSTTEHGLVLKNRESPDGFHVNAIAADPRGADEIATLAWMLGGILAHPVGRTMGFEAIKRDLKLRPDGKPGLLIHPRCQRLIKQLREVREDVKNQDDHGPDALRYFYNEYEVLGASSGLSDLYDASYARSEAAGFFTYTTGLKLDDRIGF